jgi:hypothetical protein
MYTSHLDSPSKGKQVASAGLRQAVGRGKNVNPRQADYRARTCPKQQKEQKRRITRSTHSTHVTTAKSSTDAYSVRIVLNFQFDLDTNIPIL